MTNPSYIYFIPLTRIHNVRISPPMFWKNFSIAEARNVLITLLMDRSEKIKEKEKKIKEDLDEEDEVAFIKREFFMKEISCFRHSCKKRI